MKTLSASLVPALLLAVSALSAAPLTEKDWSSKTLVMAPKQTKTETVGRRAVQWFEHKGDPAWGGDSNYTDRLAVAKPVAGDREGAPLLVILHGRGGGMPGGGIDSMVKGFDGKDSVFSAPDDFYILALDDMRSFNVQNNSTHAEFWWGACALFRGPRESDVPAIRKGETSCEKRVLDSVEWAIRTFKIDRNRVYLAGNSMGGQATLAIGLPHGEVFAAIDANVPATIWYPAARMGFIGDDAKDVPENAFDPTRFADPPPCFDWSGSDDVWSRNHDVIYRAMNRYHYFYVGLWGDYGHCGSVTDARKKNDLVERFDWTSIRKNVAYPVFTDASCNDAIPWPFSVWQPAYNNWGGWSGDIQGSSKREIAAGSKPTGQVNAYFRWKTTHDEARGVIMDLWLASAQEIGSTAVQPPASATANVSVRRIQGAKVKPGQKVKWMFGAAQGVATADRFGLITIPGLTITSTHTPLKVIY